MAKFEKIEGISETDEVMESETEEILYDDERIEGSSETDGSDEVMELSEDEIEETEGGNGISTTKSKTYSQKSYTCNSYSGQVYVNVSDIMNQIDKVMLWANSNVPTRALIEKGKNKVTISRQDHTQKGVVYYRIWGHAKGEKTYTRNVVIKITYK